MSETALQLNHYCYSKSSFTEHINRKTGNYKYREVMSETALQLKHCSCSKSSFTESVNREKIINNDKKCQELLCSLSNAVAVNVVLQRELTGKI